MKQTILITGGAGFIGSHVVEGFLEKNYKVVVIDDFSMGKDTNLSHLDQLVIYKENIISDKIIKIFRKEKPNFCIHFAAQTSVSGAMKNPYNDAMANICGSINILQACKEIGVKKFITASSAAVYGTPDSLPIKEVDSTKPISFYGLSKLVMEKYIQAFGINYLIFRFSNVYGPRQNNQGEAGVISIFDNKIRNKESIIIEDDGEQTRDFIYVRDIVNACILGIESDVTNEIINISTNDEISINNLFNLMSKIYHYNKKPIYKARRNGDIKNSRLDNSKYIKLFNVKDFVSLEEGLQKNYEFTLGEN